LTDVLAAFAELVGPEDPVCCAGGKTQWDVGGAVRAGTREVTAPGGVVSHEPAEMIVRVRAGTAVDELQAAVAEGGQIVTIEADDPARATVGGVLAVGRSGVRRLGRGPVRDAVLEVTAVSSRGEIIRAGAPLVKNVTGFDLCRLLVGSLGTLAVLAEVVLRCRPRPETEQWWVGQPDDPFEIEASLHQPLAVLWDGQATWVGLSGHLVDVEDQYRSVLAGGFRPVEGPPAPPGPERRSWTPSALRKLPAATGTTGDWLAEVGVGVVHCSMGAADRIGSPEPPSPVLARLHRAVKEQFDPTGRLNPGRSVLAGSAGSAGSVGLA
jgi:FAD binding domain